MRFHKLLAALTVVLSAVVVGACAVPQPRFECNTLTPFFAVYTLEEGDPASACGGYGGDYLNTQRFLGPEDTVARVALLPYHVAFQASPWGNARIDASDVTNPYWERESSVGEFEALLPDEQDVCRVVNLTPGAYAFEAVTDPDTGAEVLPAYSFKYDWQDVRVLSSAEFPGTLLDARVTITEDACTARYHVYAVHPVVFCATDEDCDPESDPENGRVFGSGMAAGYNPRCLFLEGTADEAGEYFGEQLSPSSDPDHPQVGICFPAADKGFDAILK